MNTKYMREIQFPHASYDGEMCCDAVNILKIYFRKI